MFISKLELKNYAPFHDLTIELGQVSEYKHLVVLVGTSELVNQGVLNAIWETQYNCMHTTFPKRETKPCQITFNNNISLIRYNERPDFAQVSFYEDGGEQSVKIPKDEAFPIFIYCNPSMGDLCSVHERTALFNSVSDFYSSSARYDRSLDENIDSMLSQIDECLTNRGIQDKGVTFAEKLALIHCGTKQPDFAYPSFLNTSDSSDFSSGNKEFLSVLMYIDLLNTGNDQNIFLMVEPFSHARNSERSEMLQFLCNYINPRCQLWVTTNNLNLSQAIAQYMPQDSQIIRFDSKVDWRNTTQKLTPAKAL